MISYSWSAPPKLPFARTQFTWVVVTFEAASPEATRVRLRQYGWDRFAGQFPEHREEFVETRAYFSRAWPRVLEALKASF